MWWKVGKTFQGTTVDGHYGTWEIQHIAYNQHQTQFDARFHMAGGFSHVTFYC